MERVPEVLQLPVIVEGRRPLALELQPLEKLDFLRGRRAAERRILQERLEPGLFDEVLFGLELDELELLHVPGDESVIENDLQSKGREVDVPRFNQRIQERDAVLDGHMKDVRIEELEHKNAHRRIAAMRVLVLEFLDTDIFHVSVEDCVSFLDPLIESWDIDLATFALEIVLNDRLVSGNVKKFEFIELESDQHFVEEPGLKEFLQDSSLSGTATAKEVEFLKRLKFQGQRPTPLYYYRELQNLRDPLHFRTSWAASKAGPRVRPQ